MYRIFLIGISLSLIGCNLSTGGGTPANGCLIGSQGSGNIRITQGSNGYYDVVFPGQVPNLAVCGSTGLNLKSINGQ